MLPSRSLPPLEFWRGVRPMKAANSRPLAKALGSRTVATSTEAVIGPMLGIVARLDLGVDRLDLSGQRRQRLAHAIGNDDLAVVVVAGRQQAFERVGVL